VVEQLALGVRGRLAINLEHDVRRVEIGAWSQQPSQMAPAVIEALSALISTTSANGTSTTGRRRQGPRTGQTAGHADRVLLGLRARANTSSNPVVNLVSRSRTRNRKRRTARTA
jgi:hypothetical protein